MLGVLVALSLLIGPTLPGQDVKPPDPPEPPDGGLLEWLYPNQPLPPVKLYESLPQFSTDPKDIDWSNPPIGRDLDEGQVITFGVILGALTPHIVWLQAQIADLETLAADLDSMTESGEIVEAAAQILYLWELMRTIAQIDTGPVGAAVGIGVAIAGWYVLFNVITFTISMVQWTAEAVDKTIQLARAIKGLFAW